MSATIDILLATYNGGRYIEEQLESILSQDYKDIRIIVRDDGSTDETLNILYKWQSLNPQTIEIIEDDLGNLGPAQNFNLLMEYSKAPYICFSDQDDKWIEHKLQRQLDRMHELEQKNPDKGILIFSDLIMCDGELEMTCPSLMENDKLNPKAVRTNQLLMQNVPYGCTILINRRLLQQSAPIDSRALLHDHWLAVIASLIGEIGYIDEALVYHRLHGKNASREGSTHRKETSADMMDKLNNHNFHNYLYKQVDQAQAVLERLHQDINEGQIQMLEDFIALKSTNGMKRKWLIVKNKFFKNELLHTLKLIIRA